MTESRDGQKNKPQSHSNRLWRETPHEPLASRPAGGGALPALEHSETALKGGGGVAHRCAAWEEVHDEAVCDVRFLDPSQPSHVSAGGAAHAPAAAAEYTSANWRVVASPVFTKFMYPTAERPCAFCTFCTLEHVITKYIPEERVPVSESARHSSISNGWATAVHSAAKAALSPHRRTSAHLEKKQAYSKT